MTSMEQDGILSAEDEVLFDTSINRYRKKFDRSTVILIAVLVGISMIAGFCGGLPLAFALSQHGCVLVN
jgi:hypothetical protein